MKYKILAVIICIALVICSVFTTLKVSDIYNYRKDLIEIIKRDYGSCYDYIYDHAMTFEKLVDVIELDNSIILIGTGKVNIENKDLILVSFFGKTNPGYVLEDLWFVDEENYNDNYYSDIHFMNFSKDNIFVSFLDTKKINEKQENYTYSDYKIKAFNKKVNFTLKYRVSKGVEYPIRIMYNDDIDYRNDTQFISCFIDKDNKMYVATHKTRDAYEPDVYTGPYNSLPSCNTAQEFKKYYGFANITEKQLLKREVEELYECLLSSTKFSGVSWHIDEAFISFGDSNEFRFPNTNNPIGSYGGSFSDDTRDICEVFELLKQYLNGENVKFKNPFE